MPDTTAPSPTLARPMSRGAAMPIQRGNYGIPARQPAAIPVQTPTPTPSSVTPQTPTPTVATSPIQSAQPSASVLSTPEPNATKQPMSAAEAFASSGPKMMDVAIPRPSRPMVKPVTAVTAVAPATTPQSAFTPAFTPSNPVTTAGAGEAVSAHKRQLLPKFMLAFLALGILLTLAGIGRYVTAGSTAGHIVAVGAVAANDGNTMTIQFTADDGLLHKFSAPSQAALIPGSAVELAYRSGAADNTVKQVASITSAKNLGMTLLASGFGLMLIAGATALVIRKKLATKKA